MARGRGCEPAGAAASGGEERDRVRIVPSILSADFGNLAEAAGEVAVASDWLHVDVMDGHFVPNLTIGPPVVKSLRRHSGAFVDCPLMMTNPGQYLEAFRDAGASSVTVHVEIGGTEELIAAARRLGLGVGLALNPDTALAAAQPFLDQIDLLLVMTVFPGFGGQEFMHEVVPKIAQARRAIDEEGLSVALEVDGGISQETAPIVAAAGARLLVAGSAVFGHERPWEAVQALCAAATSGIEVSLRSPSLP